jgi:hypothetical protein
MSNGTIMLPYTIKAGISPSVSPVVSVGLGASQQRLYPSQPTDDSYWWYFLDNATQKLVYSVVVPGSSNTTVPSGIDTYMSNSGLLFGIVTQNLSMVHLPQGALYNYMASYGSSDALNKLEQLNATLGCGYFGWVSYVLIGQGGPVGGPNPPPPSYEESSFVEDAVLQVSLMSLPNGQPPYSIIDEYTFE